MSCFPWSRPLVEVENTQDIKKSKKEETSASNETRPRTSNDHHEPSRRFLPLHEQPGDHTFHDTNTNEPYGGGSAAIAIQKKVQPAKFRIHPFLSVLCTPPLPGCLSVLLRRSTFKLGCRSALFPSQAEPQSEAGKLFAHFLSCTNVVVVRDDQTVSKTGTAAVKVRTLTKLYNQNVPRSLRLGTRVTVDII